MHTGSWLARRFMRGVRGVAVFGLVLGLLAAPSLAIAEGTIDKVGTACNAVVKDIWEWVDAQGEVPSELAGNWAVTGGSIGGIKIAKDDLAVDSIREDDTVLVEEFTRGDKVTYRSLTGFDKDAGVFVSLWAGPEGCLQLRGSFQFDGARGGTASRDMSSLDKQEVTLDYARSASGKRPTGCVNKDEPCIAITNCCSGSCNIPTGTTTGKCP